MQRDAGNAILQNTFDETHSISMLIIILTIADSKLLNELCVPHPFLCSLTSRAVMSGPQVGFEQTDEIGKEKSGR